MPIARLVVPTVAAAAALIALPAAPVGAATWRSYGLRSTAPVVGVSGSTTFFRARVVLPTSWHPLPSSASRLRFRAGHVACRFTVSISLTTVLGPTVAPADRLVSELPVTGPQYVLDSGERRPGAWRVTRRPGIAPVLIDGAYVRPAHADAGLLPAGQTAWATILATARSRPHSECHSGTWRSTMGPGLGDAFATTRTAAYARRGG